MNRIDPPFEVPPLPPATTEEVEAPAPSSYREDDYFAAPQNGHFYDDEDPRLGERKRVGVSLPDDIGEKFREVAAEQGWFYHDLAMAAVTGYQPKEQLYRPRRRQKGRDRFVFRFTEQEREILQEQARQCATTVSGVITDALEQWFKNL